MSDAVKRGYRSPIRTASAAATRVRIREAAERLFTAQGYVATSMRQVAQAAGVAERTLYDTFATKAALFAHVLGVAVAGDDEPISIAQRPWVRALLNEPDPAAALGLLATRSTELLDRAGDLIIVSLEAAGADRDMRASAEGGARATYEIQITLTRNLFARNTLRPTLTPSTAADILYVLLAPQTHQLLRRHRGWSATQYRQWIHDAMMRELLG